jgi:hypothetical protein
MNKRIRNKKAKQARKKQLYELLKIQSGYKRRVFDFTNSLDFKLEEPKENDKNWTRLAERLPNESTESFLNRASIKLSQSDKPLP